MEPGELQTPGSFYERVGQYAYKFARNGSTLQEIPD